MRFFLALTFIAIACAAECGKGTVGCPSGLCCSYWGYCGSTTAYCGSGANQCQCDCTAKGACAPAPVEKSTSGTKKCVTLNGYEWLNVRSGPSKSYNVVDKIYDEGKEVTVFAKSGGFSRIDKSKKKYVDSSFLVDCPKPEPEPEPGTYERAIFPMSVMDVTQIAWELYTHEGSMHIDCVGSTYAFAPFTGYVRSHQKYNFGVFMFVSQKKVQMPHNKHDYLTVMFMHGESIVSENKLIKRGTNIYKIGGMGDGKWEYDAHLDLGCRKGKWNTPCDNGLNNVCYSFKSFGTMYVYECLYINKKYTTKIKEKGIAGRQGASGGCNGVDCNHVLNYRQKWVNTKY